MELIIFDFDGTLGDTRANILLTMRMTLRKLGLPEKDDETNAKPHPEPVLRTLKEFGVDASDAIVVGDMPVDILMGKAAGASTCAVTYGNTSREALEEAGADIIIDDFSKLLKLSH